jgi:tRNA_anti-like
MKTLHGTIACLLLAPLIAAVPGCGKQEASKPAAENKNDAASPKTASSDGAPPRLPPPPDLVMPQVPEPKPIVPAKPAGLVKKKDRTKATESVALTAEAFAAEIRKSPDAAAKKFEPVWIELSGVVRAVGSRDKEPYVTLDTGAELFGIVCVLAQDKEPWAKISKGQKVKVRGRWTDEAVSPGLDECTLIELGTNPAQQIAAEALADEFAKNKAAARTKYQDKPLVVTGVIVDAKPNELGAIRVFLKGAGETRVDCGFNAADAAEAKALLAGQCVRVVGEFSMFESNDAPALRGCRVITMK